MNNWATEIIFSLRKPMVTKNLKFNGPYFKYQPRSPLDNVYETSHILQITAELWTKNYE